MEKQIKFLLGVIMWIIGAVIYSFSSYFVWKMDSESWLFLMLILWMMISGLGLLYFIYKLGESVKSLK